MLQQGPPKTVSGSRQTMVIRKIGQRRDNRVLCSGECTREQSGSVYGSVVWGIRTPVGCRMTLTSPNQCGRADIHMRGRYVLGTVRLPNTIVLMVVYAAVDGMLGWRKDVGAAFLLCCVLTRTIDRR